MAASRPKGGALLRLGEIEEHDRRRVADRDVVTGEHEGTGRAHHAENRHVVAALVAAIEEPARRIKIETPGIAAARPFLADKGQLASRPDGKNADAVVQPVADIYIPTVVGNQDFRGKVTASEVRRQAGERLAGSQPTLRAVVVEQDDGRGFLLQRVAPAAIGVKCEMSRTVT